ncbi:zf-C2HC5-domain-containing protein, partial [Aulographum hederae CBS 113979]
DLVSWALPKLQAFLPLDEASLKEMITYNDTLSNDEAAENLKSLLGESPQTIEFISTFNARRHKTTEPPQPARGQNDISEVPRPKKGPQKKRGSQFNRLPEERRPNDFGIVSGAYLKKDEGDYMQSHSKARKEPHLPNTLALQEKPDAIQKPKTEPSSSAPKRVTKLPPSAAGPLISDIKSKTNTNSRTSSPAPKPKTKVNIAGGTSMHGSSTTTSDLDSAIKALEVQIQSSFTPSAEENAARRCQCMATRHPLLEAAPNCLNCGKIICVKEGLGPCTFCEKPLLSAAEIQGMFRILKDERGKERQQAIAQAHRKPEVSQTPRPFANLAKPGSVSTPVSSTPSSDSEGEEKLRRAKEHRDRLLNFQTNNAQRTRIHDEAADFETPTSGQSMWVSPQERALQLKRQQKVLREQEWNAKPEWEKRQMVASIDLKGRKVVKKMAKIERPQTPTSDEDHDLDQPIQPVTTKGGGAFSKNPLLGALIRPVARESKGKGRELTEKKPTWRRVQDDNDDNEQWILDGGVYG